MKVILTDSRSDLGGRSVSAHSDCACDCQCACPTDRVSVGEPIPTLALPVAYYLELTPVCNNHCPGCGNGETFCKEPALCEHQPAKAAIPSSTRGQWLRDSGLMPLDGAEWCDLVERLASHARQFKLTGGEPTLHPDLATIVRQIDCLGVPFTLFTNGRWMDPAALLHLLRDADRFDGFLISLHGPDAATHEAFNGVPGSFAETVANIRRAAQAGFDVAVSMVIDRTNWDCVTETLDFVLCLGANHLVCNRLIGSASSVMPSEAQLRAAMAEVGRGCAQGQPVRFGNCIPQCFEPSFSRGCTAGTTFATIDPWGRMRPCNHSPLIAGDVRTQSVETVWHGEAMDRWRSLVPASCYTCAAFVTCHGGCRAQGMLVGELQDPLIADLPARKRLSLGSALAGLELRLFDQLRPVGTFAHHTEHGVDLLFSKSAVIVVPSGCDQLISGLDGSLTLRQIGRQYGDVAVDWVGVLCQEGLVSWASV